MKIIQARLQGAFLIEPKVFEDARGFFMESYNLREFSANGINVKFVQDNHSKSMKGTLRGLHYQLNPGQAKLVRVVSGEVFDVIVDIRRASPSFGQWESFILSAENKRQLFVPVGFAHGFCVLSETAEFLYKCDDYYSPKDERGIMWNDPEIGVEWPVKEPILSQRDMRNKPLRCDGRELF